ncbi:hypothetical protein HPB48_014661 [Haemaphysalis longicornis]|uniref:Uncharacterized protein n=1 Tax=Haemaphysalis longicornis TaxID=44386 RepID=A0A9J6GGU7_HAELO|nr:hypothetical protein HPB48_014661 [Haemaphysalis longicornis]
MLLLLGDLKSSHTTQSYARTSPLGLELSEFPSLHQSTLMNDTTSTARLGSKKEAHTNPDLTWIRG